MSIPSHFQCYENLKFASLIKLLQTTKHIIGWLSIINFLIVVQQMPPREDLANPTNAEKYHLLSTEIQTRSSPNHLRIAKHLFVYKSERSQTK